MLEFIGTVAFMKAGSSGHGVSILSRTFVRHRRIRQPPRPVKRHRGFSDFLHLREDSSRLIERDADRGRFPCGASEAMLSLQEEPGLEPMNSNAFAPAVGPDDEAALVGAARAGDASAFETLVARYERKIFRLAMNITQNREDAEDVMQEAFLKSYQHLGEFQGNSRFYTWLVRIAVNQALMKLRKRRPNQFSLDETAESEEDVMPRELEDWGPSPEQRYAQTELQQILGQVIADLE